MGPGKLHDVLGVHSEISGEDCGAPKAACSQCGQRRFVTSGSLSATLRPGEWGVTPPRSRRAIGLAHVHRTLFYCDATRRRPRQDMADRAPRLVSLQAIPFHVVPGLSCCPAAEMHPQGNQALGTASQPSARYSGQAHCGHRLYCAAQQLFRGPPDQLHGNLGPLCQEEQHISVGGGADG